jgi:hypothetical protein
MTTIAFQTPLRILIPKLLRSRDAWKVKATQRKAERKALQIRVRDLTASRARHRSRADELQLRLDRLQLQHDHACRQRDQLQAQFDAAPQK